MYMAVALILVSGDLGFAEYDENCDAISIEVENCIVRLPELEVSHLPMTRSRQKCRNGREVEQHCVDVDVHVVVFAFVGLTWS